MELSDIYKLFTTPTYTLAKLVVVDGPLKCVRLGAFVVLVLCVRCHDDFFLSSLSSE